jgi:ATP-dependent RNA helicase DeaD
MTFPTTHPALARALAARDYSVPTAVQVAVLDANASGRDLLVSAQTGSGKTVAFGLAMATTLMGADERLPPAGKPMALIIAPTRELALQVQRELSWLYAEAGARVVTCVGGMDGRAEARELSFGAHIVVGTPGRLRDHLERQRLDLSELKTIVLDEADEMLDLGFREDLEFILDATPEGRQTLLFSATMPREIETLARRYQRDAVRIETVGRNEQHADIDYRAIRVVPGDTENAVVNVLRFNEARAAIVFCSTREAVKRTHARLVERGFSAVALSGELTQHERTQALQALRDGRARVLVATDVAARGLDLPDLSLVIHADLPNDSETLLHRSGRTGRAGNKGLSMLIVPFNRRRKAEVLLAGAKLKITWGVAPTAEDIRARDQERFLSDGIFTDAATEEDLALAASLKAARTADEIALALVRMQRARLPAPEDLAEDRGPPPRREFSDRAPGNRFESGRDRPASDRTRPEGAAEGERRAPRPRREDNREMVWFRLDVGRDRNADPRWLLPLICKAGKVSKSEIGAIKIFDRDTRFQIVAEFADKFADSLRTNKPKEGHISRVGAHTSDDLASATQAIDAVATPRPAPETRSRPSEVRTRTNNETPTRRPYDKHTHPSEKRPRETRSSPDDARARPSDARTRPSDTNPSEPRTRPNGKPTFAQRDTFPQRDKGPKKPWEKRNKPDGKRADKPDGKRRDDRGFSYAKVKDSKGGGHGAERPRGAPHAASAGSKPPSKYAHKKKHRGSSPPPAKSH